MRRRRSFWGPVLLAGALVLAACDSGGGGEAQEPRRGRGNGGERTVAVRADAVRLLENTTRIEAVGTARARASVTLYAETGGKVTEILFKAGDFVAEGAALMRLEDDQEQLAVRLAEVSVKEAQQLLARYRRIENTGAVSDSQIDEAQTALEAARIELERAQVSLAERTLVAPFGGYVGLSDVDPGARITTTTVVTQLDDRKTLFVDFQAPEQVFRQIGVGSTVSATPFADDARTYEATVSSVDSRVDPDRRTFTVRAELDNAEDTLRPGMSFEIAASFPGRPYPAVPEAAILWGSDGSYVWIVEDGAARQEAVSIVSRRDGLVLVSAGLAEGTLIVTEGVQKIRAGTKLRILGRGGDGDAGGSERPEKRGPRGARP